MFLMEHIQRRYRDKRHDYREGKSAGAMVCGSD